MLEVTVARISLLCALFPLGTACVAEAPVDEGSVELVEQSSQSGSSKVFPVNAHPFGKSYEEWAAEWWQWTLAIPKSTNPMLGGPCDVDQSGHVFFLAGNWGGTTTRSCTIPKGKALFFPVLNAYQTSCPEYAGDAAACEVQMSEDRLHEISTWLLDQENTMSLEIDGVEVEDLDDYRVHTETFHLPAPASDPLISCSGPIRANSCGVAVGTPRNGASDGHWVMVKALKPGQHQIHFAASVPAFQFSLDITYNITVTS